MTLFGLVVIVFIALLLVLSVLAQSPKGGGLSAQFGGSSASRLVGSGRAASLMEKITWVLASILFIFAVGFNMLLGTKTGEGGDGSLESPNVEQAKRELLINSDAGTPVEIDKETNETDAGDGSQDAQVEPTPSEAQKREAATGGDQ